ncbi:uncharacterized protein PG986_004227 [Apiospora aurea]|uniref:F-box domain-containing protein n=1 Tax=Apiospora aurea TaxID=335848 RepID=A0ABR1QLZ7_9PEZI
MLNRLSVELIELIAISLPDKQSRLALQCVCRVAYSGTYHLFASDWFTTITTDFTPRSLERLTHIAGREELVSRVRCLRAGDCHRSPEKRTAPRTAAAVTRLRDAVPGRGAFVPEDGRLDLDASPAKAFRAVLLRFSACTEIHVTDELESRLFWNGVGADTINAFYMCYMMLSLLAQVKEKEETEGFWIENSTTVFARCPFGDVGNWPVGPRGQPIISSAKNLQSLALEHPSYSGSDIFFKQLARAAHLPSGLKDLTHRGLYRVSPEIIPKVLFRVRESLQSLSIRKSSVTSGTTNRFLRQLVTGGFPKLESVILDDLNVPFHPLLHNRQFTVHCRDGVELVVEGITAWRASVVGQVRSIRYRGSGKGMQVALERLGDHPTRPWRMFLSPNPVPTDILPFAAGHEVLHFE